MDNKQKIRYAREDDKKTSGAVIYRLPYDQVEQKKIRALLPGKKTIKKIRKGVIMAVIAILLMAGGGIAGKLLPVSSPVDSQTIIQQVRQLSYLTTAEAVMTTTLEEEQDYTWNNLKIPGTNRFYHMDVPAKILAGVDLSKLKPGDISIDQDSKQITIVLPHAQFLQEPNIDISKVKIITQQGIFSKRFTPNEEKRFLTEARDKLRQEAAANGILPSAEDRAVKVLQQIYKPLNYSVNVAFK
ncbi:DUF4230 domain-containing protein [Aneurinibacillus sp. Ricciae_BoGa-3]|uniref:DUF4230 domain-containing protein n=1 Tax=Aneurinibacillus sp. Ricciae_BoGa-3 TaxID=3022697 RepID=UPI00233FDF7E|nr:DUF4230 domain-containing protein [Aneurinibacillus sp. Ricciae_BoGa-3]WCK53984.1 DUF4230 domain-containing protein [Aneurinibacillus sp. Ricciae_BoGa-3]